MEKIKFIRWLKLFFIKLARARDSTPEIALGAAIGTFISVFPTFGLGMPLVILINRFIKFNLISALALSLVSNPFTSPFFMLTSYKVGATILGTEIIFNFENWRENIENTGLALLIGSTIVSGISSILAYYITKFFVTKYRNRFHNPNQI
jgi:uncharacterized protein (DUF2062 family)